MAYENLTYTNIAGEMTATYNDNNMRRQAANSPATGPGLMMTATAQSGLDVQAYRAASSVVAVQDAAREFNVKSDVTKVVAAAQSIAGDRTPLSVMRIGAKPYHMFFEKSTAGMQEKEAWIRITPFATRETKTEEGLKSTQDQLGLILMPFREGSLIRQRAIIFNTDSARPVFDSEGILIPSVAEALFDVELNVPAGYFLYTPDTFEDNILNATDPSLEEIYRLADIKAGMQSNSSINLNGTSSLNGVEVLDGYLSKIKIVDEFALKSKSLSDFNAENVGGELKVRGLGGTNGDFINHCERYAANEVAYDELEFENLAFLHCDKCYADVGAVELSNSMDLRAQASWQKNSLGYMWKYEFNGRPHVFMSARKNPFSDSNVAPEYIYDGVKYKISSKQASVGDVLNLVEFHMHPKASGSSTEVESFFDEKGLIQCHVSFDCDRADIDDTFGRNEVEFEALGAFAGNGVDAIGFSEAQYDALKADGAGVFSDNNENDGAGNGFDDRTSLNEQDHAGYIGAAWTEVNVEGQSEAEYDIYKAADYQGTIEVQTPFATLEIDGQRFDEGDLVNVVRLRPSMVDGSRALSLYALQSPERIEVDPFFMSHFELTGNVIPEAVMSRILTFTDPVYNGNLIDGALKGSIALVASNVEVREVSFLHQSATAAYKASTNYSQTIAVVPCSPPSRSRNGVSAWAGNPATYRVESNGDVKVIQNGSGVLGTKLLAGAVDYRGGAAFGGVILTNGDLLPNGIPYGIDDTDEAIDSLGNPIDLGKHVIVVGAYGLIQDPQSSISTNGRKINIGRTNPYIGNAGPMIAGLLSVLEPGTEPIGPIRGRIAGFDAQQRTPRAVLDNLAALRICMIDQTGVISSIYTAALRTSDYSKVSSILAGNAILTRMRNECMQIIGSAYTDQQISSLAQRLDGVCRSLVQLGYAQRLSAQLRGSQLDRINGIVRLSVTFIPPLSIEAISIDLTLEPPASGI
jgi:hypothetical protein